MWFGDITEHTTAVMTVPIVMFILRTTQLLTFITSGWNTMTLSHISKYEQSVVDMVDRFNGIVDNLTTSEKNNILVFNDLKGFSALQITCIADTLQLSKMISVPTQMEDDPWLSKVGVEQAKMTFHGIMSQILSPKVSKYLLDSVGRLKEGNSEDFIKKLKEGGETGVNPTHIK